MSVDSVQSLQPSQLLEQHNNHNNENVSGAVSAFPHAVLSLSQYQCFLNCNRFPRAPPASLLGYRKMKQGKRRKKKNQRSGRESVRIDSPGWAKGVGIQATRCLPQNIAVHSRKERSGCGAKACKAGRTKQNSDSPYQVDAHMPPPGFFLSSFRADFDCWPDRSTVIGPLVSVRQ